MYKDNLFKSYKGKWNKDLKMTIKYPKQNTLKYATI